MIITRTPLRVSFAGGGTDLKAYYGRERGAVLSTAIDKYIYITVNRKFDDKVRVSYSVTEMVDRAADLKHELIREALNLTGISGGIEITSISDVPSQGTGLGSSSSYTVGLLNALYAYTGKLVSAERLADEACRIEIDLCGKPIGKQDQYIAAYGGMQHIQFNPDDSVFVDPLPCHRELREQLQSSLLMLYTGLTRSANDVLSEQRKNTEQNCAIWPISCAKACAQAIWTASARCCMPAGCSSAPSRQASAAPPLTTGTNSPGKTGPLAVNFSARAEEASCCSTRTPTGTPVSSGPFLNCAPSPSGSSRRAARSSSSSKPNFTKRKRP
jgi:galactokinase/mevalonate kinase-like predicted kinase